MTLITVVVALVALVVGAIPGVRVFAPKLEPPQPPPPAEPKHFGLWSVEAVRSELGGLSPTDGKVIRIAVAVAGMEWTLPDDVANARTTLAQCIAERKGDIKDLEVEIGEARAQIQVAETRDAEVAAVAAAFGL